MNDRWMEECRLCLTLCQGHDLTGGICPTCVGPQEEDMPDAAEYQAYMSLLADVDAELQLQTTTEENDLLKVSSFQIHLSRSNDRM